VASLYVTILYILYDTVCTGYIITIKLVIGLLDLEKLYLIELICRMSLQRILIPYDIKIRQCNGKFYNP